METINIITVITALICAGLLSFSTTPASRFLAYRIGAVDVPTDARRMHKKPIPRLGGLAIVFAFLVTTIVFYDVFSKDQIPLLISLIVGGLLIVAIGIIDDIYRIPAYSKLIIQVIAAIVPMMMNITIESVSVGGVDYNLGIWAKPVTIIWILLVTNAINLIDGLDGLSCGVSAICSFSLLLVAFQNPSATVGSIILCAILAGSCMGFLPYNTNPAKIFMGDTGALFLGYTLSIVSIDGAFKMQGLLSFLIPMSIFGLPIFDMVFAIFRRIIHGQAPWQADRGHIHHRLIDLGFDQKQSVHILYAISAILGLSAVMFTRDRLVGMIIVIAVALFIFIVNINLMTHPIAREQAGFDTKSLAEQGKNAVGAKLSSGKGDSESDEEKPAEEADGGSGDAESVPDAEVVPVSVAEGSESDSKATEA